MNSNTDRDERVRQGDFPVSSASNDYGRMGDNSMPKNYDDYRAGMVRAAEMARNEFKRAPEAARDHDSVYMGGYEDACDHLSVAIAQAAVIDCVRIAGAQPDWQYHISLLLPDDSIDDAALLKVYQVVEHELRNAATRMRDLCVAKVRGKMDDLSRTAIAAEQNFRERKILNQLLVELQSLTLDQVKQEPRP